MLGIDTACLVGLFALGLGVASAALFCYSDPTFLTTISINPTLLSLATVSGCAVKLFVDLRVSSECWYWYKVCIFEENFKAHDAFYPDTMEYYYSLREGQILNSLHRSYDPCDYDEQLAGYFMSRIALGDGLIPKEKVALVDFVNPYICIYDTGHTYDFCLSLLSL